MFFFEKKNQKTFALLGALLLAVVPRASCRGSVPPDASDGPVINLELWDAKRIPAVLPSHLVMGTPTEFRINAPPSLVLWALIRQRGDNGNSVRLDDLTLQAAPGGGTLATFTPLIGGHVQFTMQADFKDFSDSIAVISADVALPEEAPLVFHAHNGEFGTETPITCRVGGEVRLIPSVIFRSQPDKEIDVWREGETFKVPPQDDPPVIEIRADGTIHALRAGRTKIQICLGRFCILREVIAEPLPERPVIFDGGQWQRLPAPAQKHPN